MDGDMPWLLTSTWLDTELRGNLTRFPETRAFGWPKEVENGDLGWMG
jgi:hypothetical protein